MSKKTRLPAPSASELAEHLAILDTCDERAAAIMAAAWVDDSLSAVLSVYLSRDGKMTDRLLGFRGPLGNFGARIHLP